MLDGVYRYNDPRTYPLSSYSYAIIPIVGKGDQRITAGKGRTMSDFMYYFLCQGQGSMPALGYSPLPANLVRAGFSQVKRIPHATVQDADVAKCGNPTFDPGDPSSNKLAREAPMPAACDKQGAGPCEASQGTGNGNGTGNDNGGGTGTTGNGTTGTGTNGDTTGTSTVDPETGLPVGSDAGGSGADLAGNATELAAFRSDGMTAALTAIAVVQLLLVLLVPPFVVRAIRRRREREQRS